MLPVGQDAPDFVGEASNGRVALRALRGRVVVLYFYPASFTPGCTVEARMFRDRHEEIRSLGAEIIGISTDPLDCQRRFASAEQLTFPLVSDARRTISAAYEALWPLGPRDKRVTYVIDEGGVVRAAFRHECIVSLHLADVIGFLYRHRAQVGKLASLGRL